jgi:hypothetical protein
VCRSGIAGKGMNAARASSGHWRAGSLIDQALARPTPPPAANPERRRQRRRG